MGTGARLEEAGWGAGLVWGVGEDPGQVVAGCHGSPNPRATISHEKRRARALPGHPGSYLRGAAVAELVGDGLDAPCPRHRDVAAL